MFALWKWMDSEMKFHCNAVILYLQVILEKAIFDFIVGGCVCVFSLSFFSVTSAGNPWLLILLERKPWKVSDWSQFSPKGAALPPFRGVAQPPNAAGGRTQPHRSSLCSGPNRRMTLFLPLLSHPNPQKKWKKKHKQKNKRDWYYYYYNTIFFLKTAAS